jgi:hypothetical protein
LPVGFPSESVGTTNSSCILESESTAFILPSIVSQAVLTLVLCVVTSDGTVFVSSSVCLIMYQSVGVNKLDAVFLVFSIHNVLRPFVTICFPSASNKALPSASTSFISSRPFSFFVTDSTTSFLSESKT